MTTTITVTTKRQVVLPKAMCERKRIQPGTSLRITESIPALVNQEVILAWPYTSRLQDFGHTLPRFLVGRTGCSAVEHVGAELEAKLLVLDPLALGGHPLSSADRSQGANHGDQVAVPFGLHLELAEQYPIGTTMPARECKAAR